MAKTRGNPFTGDGTARPDAWKGKGGDNSAVRVTAHMRKRPVRTISARPDDNADQAFAGADFARGPQAVTGLAGEPQVNHMKAAVGLLNRKRV